MGILDFFKQSKKTETEMAISNKASDEQVLFADVVLKIVNPTMENFGFTRHLIKVEEFFSNIVWRKDNQYVRFQSSNYPTDYPYYYSVILGDGDSDDFYEYDWNSIVLWKLKNKIESNGRGREYDFPFGDKVESSILEANKDLIKYGDAFLRGDLTLFMEVRAEQNKNREPYKIHSPDKDGNYKTTDELKSLRQKNKYS